MKKKKEIIAWMVFSGSQPALYIGQTNFSRYGVYKTKKEANFWGGEPAKKVKIMVLK